MKSRLSIMACLVLTYVSFLLAAPRPVNISAATYAQATAAPTEEPTKRPYAFPTPIFIPTYADDTPVPRKTLASPSPAIQPGTDTYTVQSGDSLWVISQNVYGDGSKYKLIMEANELTDQSKLRVGSVLKIPSVSGLVPSLAPTSSPNFAPTQILPTAISTSASLSIAPTLTPTATVTSMPTPTVSSGFGANIGIAIINIASAILFLTGMGTGGLAYVRYQRNRRFKQLSSGKQPIRVRQ